MFKAFMSRELHRVGGRRAIELQAMARELDVLPTSGHLSSLEVTTVVAVRVNRLHRLNGGGIERMIRCQPLWRAV